MNHITDYRMAYVIKGKRLSDGFLVWNRKRNVWENFFAHNNPPYKNITTAGNASRRVMLKQDLKSIAAVTIDRLLRDSTDRTLTTSIPTSFI